MLAETARAAIGLTLTTSCASLKKRWQAKAEPRGFKIGICDWTIGKRADPASFEIAKRIGLDGVQVDLGRGQVPLLLFSPDLQKKILAAAKKHNMEIASLAMGVLNQIPYKSDPRAEQWVEQCIDVCKAMGTNIVLLAFFGKGDLRNDQKGIDVVVQRLKKVAPKAEEAGVVLGIESMLSAKQHIDIIERVGSPAVKVYYDVANSQKAGYDI